PTGTPAYVAPEQITEAEVGPAADRYSFAVMAYQLITGRLPFEAKDFMKALYAHVQQRPTKASQAAPGLPKAVNDIFYRGLAKKPSSRWATCTEMVDALDLVLTGSRGLAGSDQVVPDESVLLSTARITEYKAPNWLR